MKNIVTVLLVLAVLVLVVGVASHAARVDVSYVAGTWHVRRCWPWRPSWRRFSWSSACWRRWPPISVPARDRHTLEEELQRTYIRLRAAENAIAPGAGTASPPAAEPPAGTEIPPTA